MRELTGKTAFVTGGASGIGLAMGRAFVEAGMKVMLADIEVKALNAAVKDLKKITRNVSGVRCDVTDPASVKRAAAKTFKTFGKVHVLCNNAGVAARGGIDDISLESWRWVIDVNLMGVVHGIKAFLPHMRAHREGGHVVNTASMAGMQSGMGFHPYTASKFAVVCLSEGLAKQLEPENIGVTVLCPAYVRTQIGSSERNRQKHYGAPPPLPDPSTPAGAWMAELSQRIQSGHDPAEIAAQVLRAIKENELHLLTHPKELDELETRLAEIKAAMDRAKARQ